MPATLTYPGVYIEEISSGVHTITGVATSIAAFVGWAPKGPTDAATIVLSFSDFARQFGGLTSGNYLGYAVNQFFGNGGQQAYIVRLAWTDAATATAPVGGTLVLFASSPGGWGNDIQVSVTRQIADPTRFLVEVSSIAGGQVLESFPNLSATTSDPQYVVTVIDAVSDYITFIDPATQIAGTPLATPVNTAPVPLLGGLDGTVLIPNDGNFETALTSNPVAGVFLLDRVAIFNLLCVPGETDGPTIATLQKYCHDNRAFYIVDAPQTAKTSNLSTTGPVGSTPGSLTGQFAMNSAYYFPWILAPDPLAKNHPTLFPPCGFVAGMYASTDSTRGSG